LKKHVSVVIKN